MFKITQRQYNIIIKQVQKNYPFESGGFIGGKDFIIKAVLPVFNKDGTNKQDVFGLNQDDMNRAHQFFDDHGLDYYGIYHSHPKGPAIPSEQDLAHIQRYLFIISLMHFNHPDFAAYQVTGIQQANRVPLDVISDATFTAVDPKDGTALKERGRPVMPINQNERELNKQVHRIIRNEAVYKQYIRQDDSGHFSTLA